MGNQHVRFDEREIVSVKPRRGSPLAKGMFTSCALIALAMSAFAEPREIRPWAYEGEVTTYWEVIGDKLIITGNGPIPDFTYGEWTSPEIAWYAHNSEIRTIEIREGVTRIGDYAFIECAAESISLPESMTETGDGVFQWCRNLTSVKFPKSITKLGGLAFNGCSSLVLMALPSGITSVPGGCFSQCTRLKTVVIPAGVTSFGRYVFSNCSALAEIGMMDPSAVTLAPQLDSTGVTIFVPVGYDYTKVDTSILTLDHDEACFVTVAESENGTVSTDRPFYPINAAKYGTPQVVTITGEAAVGFGLNKVTYSTDGGETETDVTIPMSFAVPNVSNVIVKAAFAAPLTYFTVDVVPSGTGIFLKSVMTNGVEVVSAVPGKYSVDIGQTIRVEYALEEGYSLANASAPLVQEFTKSGVSEAPSGCELGVPTNPWTVGTGVTAYIQDGTLRINGSGAMDDFAAATDAPWVKKVGGVSSVVFSPTVIPGANALEGFGETTTFLLTRAQMPAGGGTPGGIAPAEVETIEVVGGVAYLGVSVCTNGDITAEKSGWGKVKFAEDTDIGLNADGTQIIVPVPATDKQGFYYLQSIKPEL